MSTVVDVYKLVHSAKIANRTTKQLSNNVYKAYGMKNNDILKAVELILKTKTKSVWYIIDTDRETGWPCITFKFKKKEKWMFSNEYRFHLLKSIYKSILELERKY